MKQVNWGMIGCGKVAEQKSAPALYKTKRSNLVAVMSRNIDTAADYAQRHGIPKVHETVEALVNDDELDAIYIATPPSSHRAYTLAAAAAGRAVYVEKPMGLNYAECLDMITACENAKVPLYVAYYRRAMPYFLKIKSLLEEGQIGEIRTIHMTISFPPSKLDLAGTYQWVHDPAVAGCGKFCEMCCHMLDLMQFYFGPIASINGFVSNQADLYRTPDTVVAEIAFENGLTATGNWCFVSYGPVDRTEITGTKGRITYATYLDAPIVVEVDGMRQEFGYPHLTHVQQPLIQTIVDDLAGSGSCPSTGDTAAMTNYWLDKLMSNVAAKQVAGGTF